MQAPEISEEFALEVIDMSPAVKYAPPRGSNKKLMLLARTIYEKKRVLLYEACLLLGVGKFCLVRDYVPLITQMHDEIVFDGYEFKLLEVESKSCAKAASSPE